ncbi:MAG: hypothetical protein QG622_1617 [Actinomycetota bacterium]|nr:hypothetical protein [Actinomycetota bacterium]
MSTPSASPSGPAVPPPSPWAAPPSPRPLFSGRFWRSPRAGLRPGVLAGLAGVAVLAGSLLLAEFGIQWLVLAIAMTIAVLAALPARTRLRNRWDRGVLALVLNLVAVAAVRTSVPMTLLCLLAAAGLAAALAAGAWSWSGLVVTPLLVPLNGLRALPWAERGLRRARTVSRSGPLIRGLVVAGLLTWVCVALLASADSAFAGLLTLVPLDRAPETLIARCLLGLVVALFTLALAFTAAAPPRWRELTVRRGTRPPVEWMLPLVAVDVVLATFLAVQTAVLFGAYPDELVSGDATPAERAREGFGQLVVLTLVVAALLTWAARVAADAVRDRRLLATAGGALGVLVLVVVASALRRLWLYEQAFGWTVMRLDAGVFEVWLALVIAGTGLAWVLRRTTVMARVVPVSAGIGLLLLALAGPDALVASWNVDRWQRTGKIDVQYLGALSDDAVPALKRLPEPLRTCVLAGRSATAPWYAANVSRLRARNVLESLGGPIPERQIDC